MVKGLRWLVAHLPAFRLERCGFGADDVAALVDDVQNATRIVARTPGAADAGLRIGMTAAEARSLVPEVELQRLEAVGERADRAALLRAFEVLSDRVTFQEPDDILVEISRTADALGGEEAVLARACGLAEALGHQGVMVIADDPIGGSALAQLPAAGRGGVIPVGALAERLADLPIGLLRASSALVHALRAVGIERAGQLARLDPASVAGRYGEEGARVHRIARGLPAPAREVPQREDSGDLPRVSTPMAGATSTLQLHFVLPGLIGRLADALAARDLAVVRLEIALRLDQRGRAPTTVVVGVGRPTRSPRVLERLIRARLEGLRLDAPVEDLALEVVEAAPEQAWQPGLTDRTEATEPLPELLARLRDHLGEDALITPRLVDAWRPEAAWRPVTVAHLLPKAPGLSLHGPDGAPRGAGSDDPVEVQRAWVQQIPVPRPALLLPEPVPIEVELCEGIPARVDRRRVLRADGPERLEGEWWSPTTAFDRSYWAVELDRPRALAWIVQEHGRWSLHGWFD